MENKNLEETDVNEKQKARNGKSAMPMGVIFIVLGVAFVINGIRGSIKAGKIQKESNAESEAQASETETSRTVESKMESTSSLNKKMSIADRANLVSQLGDATKDEE